MACMLPSVVPLLALALQASWGAAQQFVLDDMDAALSISSANTFEGSYEPCLSDAYNGQFHHDWAMNKGEASFTMGFQPPRSGCYAIQEHHPGSLAACRRYLPQNVNLTVDYCKGLSTTIYYDQSSPATAGKWNTLGMWMFFEGWSGALTVRSHATEVCSAGEGKCFMLVDAFRLTRVGDTCADATAPAPAPVVLPAVPEATSADTPEQGVEHASGTDVPEQVMEFEGLLTLEVVDTTRDSLWDLRATIGDALEVHLDLEQVSIVSLVAASARRLSGADASKFEARFAGQRMGSEFPTTGGLTAALQAHLNDVGSTSLVTSAEVDWVAVYAADLAGPGEPSAAGEPEPVWIWPLLAVAALALACLLAAAAARACRPKVVSADAVDAEAPPESLEKPVDVVKPLEESDKWDTASVSTGTPDSESSPSERPSTTEAVEPAGVVGTCA